MMYDNGTKQTMRGWTWNRICEFIPRSIRPMARGLYLSAEDDFDRSVAVSKGFVSQNLVAVDRSSQAIEKVRKGGGVGIVGELESVIASGPFSGGVSLVFADLTCGIYDSTLDLMRLTQSLPNCAVAFNLKRGRDKDGADWSKSMTDWEVGWMRNGLRIFEGIGDFKKHRGMLLFYAYCRMMMTVLIEDFGLESCEARGAVNGFLHQASPSIASYRSKDDHTSYFDTIVFRTGRFSGLETADAIGIHADKLASKHPKKMAALKRRIAALKATRTRSLASN